MAMLPLTTVVGGRTLPVMRLDQDPILQPTFAPQAELKRLCYFSLWP
jgi:hypothetical protein